MEGNFQQVVHCRYRCLTGEAEYFRRPIVSGFSVRRDIIATVEKELAKGSLCVVVHGTPLSGITNALAQIAKSDKLGPALFIDTAVHANVLQWIANQMSAEIGISISKDDLRGWFNTTRGLVKITLILDGLPKTTESELIEWASGGHFQLVLGMDSETHRKACSLPGEIRTRFLGRLEFRSG